MEDFVLFEGFFRNCYNVRRTSSVILGSSLLATVATTNVAAEDFTSIKSDILTKFTDAYKEIEKISSDFDYGCIKPFKGNFDDKESINKKRESCTDCCERGYYGICQNESCFLYKNFKILMNLLGKLKEISIVDTYKLTKVLTEFKSSFIKYQLWVHLAHKLYNLVSNEENGAKNFIMDIKYTKDIDRQDYISNIQKTCEEYIKKVKKIDKEDARLTEYILQRDELLARHPEYRAPKEKAQLDQIVQIMESYISEHPELREAEKQLREIDGKINDYLKNNPQFNINSKTSVLYKLKKQKNSILNNGDDNIKKLRQKKEDCLKRYEKSQLEDIVGLSEALYKDLYSVIDYRRKVSKEYQKLKNKIEDLEKKSLKEQKSLKREIEDLEWSLSNNIAERVEETVETEKTTEISTTKDEKEEKRSVTEEKIRLENLKSKLEALKKENIRSIYEETKKFVENIREKYKESSEDYNKWSEKLTSIRFVDGFKETKALAIAVIELENFLSDFTEKLSGAKTAEDLSKEYSIEKEDITNGLIKNEVTTFLDKNKQYSYVIEKKTTIPLEETISRVRAINVPKFFEPKNGDIFFDYDDYIKLENNDVEDISIDIYEPKDDFNELNKITKKVNLEKLKKIIQNSFVCFNLSYDQADNNNYGFKKIFESCENKDNAFRYHFSKKAAKKVLEFHDDKDLLGRESLVMLRNKSFINTELEEIKKPLPKKSKEFIERFNKTEYNKTRLLIREEGKEELSLKGNRVNYHNGDSSTNRGFQNDYESFADNSIFDVKPSVEGTASGTIIDENDTGIAEIRLSKDVYCIFDQQPGFLTISCGTEKDPYTQIDKFENIFKTKIKNNNVFDALVDKRLEKDLNIGMAVGVIEEKKEELKEKVEKDDKRINELDSKIFKMLKKIEQF